jgi:hypothetical protein
MTVDIGRNVRCPGGATAALSDRSPAESGERARCVASLSLAKSVRFAGKATR